MSGRYTRTTPRKPPLRGAPAWCPIHRSRYTPWEIVNGVVTRFNCAACENVVRAAAARIAKEKDEPNG